MADDAARPGNRLRGAALPRPGLIPKSIIVQQNLRHRRQYLRCAGRADHDTRLAVLINDGWRHAGRCVPCGGAIELAKPGRTSKLHIELLYMKPSPGVNHTRRRAERVGKRHAVARLVNHADVRRVWAAGRRRRRP